MTRIALTLIFVGLAGTVLATEIPLSENAYKLSSARYDDSGALLKCELKVPTVIQGYSCRGWVWFHPDGALKQFRLAEPTTIQDIPVPPKSTVFLDEDGSLTKCWFSKDVTVQGIPCNGGSMKVTTVFHKNGKILCCFLSESTEIQGIPCKASVFKPVYFHPSGKLKTCTLARRHTMGEQTYRKGTTLDFDETGGVVPSDGKGQ